MKAMAWICIAIGLVIGAASLACGGSGTGVLLAALLLVCCGGMLLGTSRRPRQ